MPQFILNEKADTSSIALDDFTHGYIEAMFFTNGDTGDDNESLLNDLGIAAITLESMESIKHDCRRFMSEAATQLEEAINTGYTLESAGRDFWFTRQRHGVGFWDRDELRENDLGEKLSDIARKFGEVCVCVCGDEIIY
jgi:hypothetical protein